MLKYLLSTSVKYRVETEEDAKALIENIKTSTPGDIAKYDCIYKNQKIKGDIAQEWYEVTVTAKFNDPKEPLSVVNVIYEVE